MSIKRAGIVLVCILTSNTIAATKYAKVGGLTTGNCDTWASACAMDRAISLASSGDSVWARKTSDTNPPYYGPVELKNGVKIIGGFAGTETQASQSNPTTKVTTINGGGTQRCVTSDSNSSSTMLRGFTVSNCRDGNTDWDSGGGGALLTGSDAIFVNCVFDGNTAVRFGAGAAIKGGSPKFFNCTFKNNGSGTAGSAEDINAQPTAGGAVYLESGTPSFVNCLFFNNKAAGGAAIANRDGSPSFTNCTIADNYAKYSYGGALFDESGKGTLRNCILWGNTAIKGASQILNAPEVSTTVSYSDVSGGWTGTGNINSDPVFIKPQPEISRCRCPRRAITSETAQCRTTRETWIGTVIPPSRHQEIWPAARG